MPRSAKPTATSQPLARLQPLSMFQVPRLSGPKLRAKTRQDSRIPFLRFLVPHARRARAARPAAHTYTLSRSRNARRAAPAPVHTLAQPDSHIYIIVPLCLSLTRHACAKPTSRVPSESDGDSLTPAAHTRIHTRPSRSHLSLSAISQCVCVCPLSLTLTLRVFSSHSYLTFVSLCVSLLSLLRRRRRLIAIVRAVCTEAKEARHARRAARPVLFARRPSPTPSSSSSSSSS